MKMPRILLILVGLAAGCTHALAQATAPAAPAAKPAVSSPAVPPADQAAAPVAQVPAGTDYVVGPLDVLNVRIYGEDKLSGKIRIDNDGSFPFEYLGRVKAEGLTPAQIEVYLANALGDGYLRNPQVSVEVIEYRSQSVFVTGEVRSPNKYMLPGNSTLMDVLTLAGSVNANAGSWVQITHARQGADVLGPAVSTDYDLRVNLRDIQTGKAQNVKMQDGDTIFVPKAERVWVVGQVRNPQGVVHEEGMTVFEAIAAAGGITEKGSNSRIEIVRIENGQRKSIDAKQTDVLKPGDQVNVRTRRL
jgi:polysaccharide export outer membrane protein